MEYIGITGKRFCNQSSTFDSPRNHHQEIHPCAPQRERGSVQQAPGSETPFIRYDKQSKDTIPMPTFARRPSTKSSTIPAEFPLNSMFGPQRQQISEPQFHKFPTPQSFLVWKIRLKNQVTTCSDFPSESMLWIKEVEIVETLKELKSSRSVCGKNFPDFEMLDAKIASALNSIIQNAQCKKMVSLEEQKAQKEDWFLRGRQIAFMIYDYFRVTGAHDTVLDYADLFSVTLHDTTQDFDTRWDEVLLSMSKIPSNDILESLYKLRIRESAQLKTVLELSDMEIHQKISMPNYQKLKTMVKRSLDQKLRLRNFDARHERIVTGAVVKNRKKKCGAEGGKGTCYQWKEKGQRSKGIQCSFRLESNDRDQKPEHTAATPSEPSTTRGRSVSKKTSIQGKIIHGMILRQPCRYYLKGTCTRSPREYWHPPECQFCKSETGCKAGDKCLFRIMRLMNNQTKSQKLLFTKKMIKR